MEPRGLVASPAGRSSILSGVPEAGAPDWGDNTGAIDWGEPAAGSGRLSAAAATVVGTGRLSRLAERNVRTGQQRTGQSPMPGGGRAGSRTGVCEWVPQ